MKKLAKAIINEIQIWLHHENDAGGCISNIERLAKEALSETGYNEEYLVDGISFYSSSDSDGMVKAFREAGEYGHGHRESLYAVATYIMRKRGYLPPKSNVIEGQELRQEELRLLQKAQIALEQRMAILSRRLGTYDAMIAEIKRESQSKVQEGK